MTKNFEAAKAIRGLANLYKSMVSAADTLEAIGSVEQAAEEAKAAAAQAAKQRDELNAEVVALTECRDRLNREAALALETGDAAIAKAKTEATRQADAVIADATARAADIVSEAEAQASLRLDRLQTEVSARQAEIDTRQDVLAGIEQSIEAAREQHAQLQTRIAELKDKLSAVATSL